MDTELWPLCLWQTAFLVPHIYLWVHELRWQIMANLFVYLYFLAVKAELFINHSSVILSRLDRVAIFNLPSTYVLAPTICKIFPFFKSPTLHCFTLPWLPFIYVASFQPISFIYIIHLRFKQTQSEICHSPKVEDEVEYQFFTSWRHFNFFYFFYFFYCLNL